MGHVVTPEAVVPRAPLGLTTLLTLSEDCNGPSPVALRESRRKPEAD